MYSSVGLQEQLAAKTRELDEMVQASNNASSTLNAALLKKDLDFASIVNNINLLSDIWNMVSRLLQLAFAVLIPLYVAGGCRHISV
jgi:hypothetical protein